jgi:DHA2 family multidrug resistance protein
MFGTFMAVLDSTIVNVAISKIMASFGTSLDKIEWVMTAYLLVFAVVLPCSGWIADHFGYKRTYFLALLLFTLGSFCCSLSWTEDILIASRVIQGAGAGFLMPVGMAIVTREFPIEKRGVALGFWGIAAAASVSLGPMIGGYLIDNFSWHMIFDINIPIGILGMCATAIIQREYKTETTRSFDLIGFISITIFLSFLLLALSNANAPWNTGGWTSNYIITCFMVSSIGFVVFLFNEFNVEYPLIDLRLLKELNFGLTNIILFIFGLAMFGSTFLLPLYLQNSLNYTAYQAGLVFLPVGIIQMFVSPMAGILSDRMNPKILAFIGIVFLSFSLILNYYLSMYSEHAQIMLPLYLRGFAMGLLFTPLSTIALMNIPKKKMAQASGLFNVIRQLGGSFGIAILGTLFVDRIIYHTTIYSQSGSRFSEAYNSVFYRTQLFVQGACGGCSADVAARSHALIAKHFIDQAYIQAVNDDFLVAGVISILCLIPLFILKIPKHRKKETAEL